MALWPVIAGIKAGSAALSYIQRRRNQTPRLGQTEYGRELRRRSEEGIYSPQARETILNRVGGNAGIVSQQSRSRVRGYLQARGMGGSVAGASVLAEPATQQMRTVAGAAENLYTDNETSKVQSRDQYLRAIYENDVQRRAERVGDFQGLVGGMGDAAITGLQVREQEKAAGAERARQWDKDRAETSDKRRQRLIELANVLSDSDDPEDRERARKILYEIAIMKD